jgi:hypothetical protein
MINFKGIEGMIGTYEQRKISNDLVRGVTIDTCAVIDNPKRPFETGIKSDLYNNGQWVIVEEYIDKESAVAGHDKWVKIFQSGLPDNIEDVSTCFAGKLIRKINGK